jgi:hypothetical protein
MDKLYFCLMIQRLLRSKIIRDLAWSPVVGILQPDHHGKDMS